MQFLFPWFLGAAAALAIPIVIHLFYFRRYRKVRFTNVRFLKEVQEETSNRRRLRNLLVLAARCLALLALVAGFAQPFLPGSNTQQAGKNAVSIFVDNSFSMSALASDQALLNQARVRARQIIEAYSDSDQFQILSADFEGRHQRWITKTDALIYVDELVASPASRTLSQILARQQQLLRTSDAAKKTAFVVSDFQTQMADFDQIADTTVTTWLVPLQAVENRNVAIDSAWLASPVMVLNQSNQLLVKTTNYGNQRAENLRLSLIADGQSKAVGNLSLEAGASKVDTIQMSPTRTGWQKASLHVSDFPIQFDDTLHLAYVVEQNVPVLLVRNGAPNKYLDAAFRSMPGVRVTEQNAQALDYGAFSQYRLILLQDLSVISSGLAGELRQYAEGGGTVLIFPPAGADVASYNNLMAQIQGVLMGSFESANREVSQINTEEFTFNDVYLNKRDNLRLPKTTGGYSLKSAGIRGGDYLLTYRDGSPFIVRQAVGNGYMLLCAAPLDPTYSNLVLSGEVFVPLLFKAAVSGNKNRKITYSIGDDDYFEADNSVRIGGDNLSYKLKGPTGEFIPEQRSLGNKVSLNVNKLISQAGNYDLTLQRDSVLAVFGFNYPRLESELSFLSSKDLEKEARGQMGVLDASSSANLTGLVGERQNGTPLWRLFLWLALAALLIEVLLLRFWKV
jgi:hypothetical protein